jgi:DNA-binding MarR family transcriptional regulator
LEGLKEATLPTQQNDNRDSSMDVLDHTSIVETLIMQTRDLLVKLENRGLGRFGLTIMQFAVLDLVSILGDQAKPTVIANKLLRQPHSISGLLIRMEKDGLVTRTKDPDSKRNVNIGLTDKGLQLLNQAREVGSSHELRTYCSKEEIEQLIVSL